jgi:CBS domain containing-hemolysin-like protein
MMHLFLNIILIVSLMALSAFFSGSETGVYRLSRIRLRIRVEKGRSPYKILFNLLKDGQGLIFTLLLGNNLANYFLTSVVTMMILTRIDSQSMAQIYTTAMLTPVLFVFGELIPKNIFYFRADSLLPHFAWFIWGLDKIFTFSGIKIILKMISRLISAGLNLQVDTAKAIDVTQRHQVHQIIHETQEEGLLSQTQKEMMTRLIDFPSMAVSSVMIPLCQTDKVPVDISRAQFIEHLKTSRFTRQVVYGTGSNDILGYISIYDVLGTGDGFQGIQEFVNPLPTLDKKTSVIEAINTLRNRRERIAIVVESLKKETHPLGIITVADLVEEITGELNV